MRILDRARAFVRESRETWARLEGEIVEAKMLSAKVLIGQIERMAAEPGASVDIRRAEFKVFSQFGEDGIIQYLIRRAAVPEHLKTFVEFGVESYVEANTRFLLMNDNWRGLVMDGSPANMAAVRETSLYWRQDITAKAAFIDRDNINGLIADAGFGGEIGLLSIDLDGNDYWVWEKIAAVNPIIVVAEYNSVFGAKHAITVPYDPTFERAKAHYSHLYWGVSLRALEVLGRRKGYALVGSNSAGNNAFFVRRDCLNGQPELTSDQAYVESRFRESRDENGRLNYLSGDARLREIADMPVVDVERNVTTAIRNLAGNFA